MTQYTKRDDRAWREALLVALPQVRRFARSLTGNWHDADDLLQATVERALTREAPDESDLLRWMFRVCRNLWIDELRARTVRRTAAASAALEAEPGGDEAIDALTLRDIDRAMQRLPIEQREVVSLVSVEGLSYREAAELLDVPIGTVMSRLARARAALARQLAEPSQAPRTGAALAGEAR